MKESTKHIAIVTCCMDDWGGSEELWARAIPFLREHDISFTLYKDRINFSHPEIQNLRKQHVACVELDKPQSLLKRTRKKYIEKYFNGSALLFTPIARMH
ncbi:hypothetical protein [Niabella ginsengisoli]|uniref:Glycosyltransferase family 1 protein n=1 Tax=Niabella ginsengisoli TaxID=522298 RepID=A0ABS9SH01_9BACT|nr:hypothetical protein [Niabella ginsengisoli]MCH5597637.1 hypothetical protein [Niabella ginsengisoli]